jgi:hypothetical protein
MAAQLGKLMRDHLLRRATEAQKGDIPAPVDASAGERKAQLRIRPPGAGRISNIRFG